MNFIEHMINEMQERYGTHIRLPSKYKEKTKSPLATPNEDELLNDMELVAAGIICFYLDS